MNGKENMNANSAPETTVNNIKIEDIKLGECYEIKFGLHKGKGFKWYPGKVKDITATEFKIDFGKNITTYTKSKVKALIKDGSIRTPSKDKTKKKKTLNHCAENELDTQSQQDLEYEVECIIDDSCQDGKWMYKIRWKGWGEEEDTWEHEDD